jgi:uncharacterized protein YjiS (DUF1127 family)
MGGIRTAMAGLLAPRLRRRGVLEVLVQGQALWRSRRRLATLDEAALRDLGLTREQAMDEAARAVWDVPSHWLK